MLPLRSLLNPSSTAPPLRRSQCGSSHRIEHLSDPNLAGARMPAMDGPAPRRGRKTEDPNILSKSRARGPINYPPFEDLDQISVTFVSKFQVAPFGKIHQNYQHIPYSSSKKDLFEKTGRESIEAFKYEFRVPGHDRTFVVMWDYNIGIVRMNPFIKWGGFPKTKSSQMLDKNPGLRDISPGPTGGAVLAQGYWVPYNCARALCATFCYPIAGALIPLFGPSFPADCTPPETAGYNEMIISRPLLAEATRQSEISRRYYMNKAMEARNGVSMQPRLELRPLRASSDQGPLTPPLRPALHCDSSWGISHVIDSHSSLPSSASGDDVVLRDYEIASRGGNQFTAVNAHTDDDFFKYSDPFLSAVPHHHYRHHDQHLQSNAELQDMGNKAWDLKRRRIHYDFANKGTEKAAIPQRENEKKEPDQTRKVVHHTLRPLEHYNAAMVLVTMKEDFEEQTLTVEDPSFQGPVSSTEIPRGCKRRRARSL